MSNVTPHRVRARYRHALATTLPRWRLMSLLYALGIVKDGLDG